MINKKINLKEYYPMLEKDVWLQTYCPDNSQEVDLNRKRKTLLIIPGGGYSFVSEREGEPVALRFMASDINCFVLTYNVGPYKTVGYPLYEAFAAVAYIRSHHEEYHVLEDQIAVIGFSAGGHLAASISCYMGEDKYAEFLKVNKDMLKINATVLVYPVITMDEKTHLGTMENITLNKPELIDYYSIEKHVTKDFPKTFIWTTFEDNCVPSINSLAIAKALDDARVPYELHVYPIGDHGTSLADQSVYKDQDKIYVNYISYFKGWADLAIKFLKEIM